MRSSGRSFSCLFFFFLLKCYFVASENIFEVLPSRLTTRTIGHMVRESEEIESFRSYIRVFRQTLALVLLCHSFKWHHSERTLDILYQSCVQKIRR